MYDSSIERKRFLRSKCCLKAKQLEEVRKVDFDFDLKVILDIANKLGVVVGAAVDVDIVAVVDRIGSVEELLSDSFLRERLVESKRSVEELDLRHERRTEPCLELLNLVEIDIHVR